MPKALPSPPKTTCTLSSTRSRVTADTAPSREVRSSPITSWSPSFAFASLTRTPPAALTSSTASAAARRWSSPVEAAGPVIEVSRPSVIAVWTAAGAAAPSAREDERSHGENRSKERSLHGVTSPCVVPGRITETPTFCSDGLISGTPNVVTSGLLDTWSRAVYLVAMSFRRRLTLLVVGAIALLAPLAHASPPDPAWIAGFWDNADYDDVVLLVTSAVGTADSRPPYVTVSAPVVIASVSSPDESPVSGRPLSSWNTRAPPTASA